VGRVRREELSWVGQEGRSLGEQDKNGGPRMIGPIGRSQRGVAIWSDSLKAISFAVISLLCANTGITF